MFSDLIALKADKKKISPPKPEDEGDLIVDCPLEDPDIASDREKLDILYDVVENYLSNGRLSEADRVAIRDNDLLQGTSLLALATESFGGAITPVLSQESLLAATAQKAKEYAAKTAAFFSNTYRKIRDAVAPKIEATGELISKAYNASKDAVLSHPIASIVAATAAATAIAAGITIATGALKTGDVEKAYNAFRNVKWPGWKVPTKGKGPAPSGVKVDPAPAGTPLLEGPAHGGGVKGATISSLKDAYTAFKAALEKVWAATSSYRDSLGKASNAAGTVLKPVGDKAAWLIGYPYTKLKNLRLLSTSLASRGMIGQSLGVEKVADYIQGYLDFLILGSLSFLTIKIFGKVVSTVKSCFTRKPKTDESQEPEGGAQPA